MFDLLWSDVYASSCHDLGGEIFVDSNRPDTGAELARWVAGSKYDNSVSIVIHSMNPDGQIAMYNELTNAGYEFTYITPFRELLTQFKNGAFFS